MIWVLICLLFSNLQAQSPPESVLLLDDDTFEHTTQASTGQTTGNWLVLFSEPSHANHKELINIWGRLSDYAMTERLGVLLAQVLLAQVECWSPPCWPPIDIVAP